MVGDEVKEVGFRFSVILVAYSEKNCPAERRGKGGDPFDSILSGFSLSLAF